MIIIKQQIAKLLAPLGAQISHRVAENLLILNTLLEITEERVNLLEGTQVWRAAPTFLE